MTPSTTLSWQVTLGNVLRRTVVLLFLILAGFPVVTDMIQKLMRGGSGLVDFIAAFSVMTHFYAFQKGVLDLRDVVFFLSLIGFSLFTTSVILRAQRSG